MADIRYEKILQRQGLRSELPVLDTGEIGFTTDTSQVFIGTDPSVSTVYTVVIAPFPNAREVIQSLLDSDVSYEDYTVSDFLEIQATSQSEAADIVNFINSRRAQNVARIESNVEMLTNLNINQYINPSDFNSVYNAQTPLNPNRSLMTKVLDSGDADTFLEFDSKQVFHMTVKYTLVQNNGWHRRTGVITLLADNSVSGDTYVGFDDDQTLMNAAISGDFIMFEPDVDTVKRKVRILFTQPDNHETKIYYRIERWNIGDVVTGAFTDMPVPPPNQVLGVGDDDGALGLYGDAVLGVNRGSNT